jgi:L-fuconolactonase
MVLNGGFVADSQIHVWSADPADWVALDGNPVARSWGRHFGIDELRESMAAAGVTSAVLIPPRWDGLGNALVRAAADAHPETFTAMGRIDVWNDHVADELSAWLRPGMSGVRVMFTSETEVRGLAEGAADPFWAAAELHGVPVMVSAPGRYGELARIARRFPGLRLAVDHLGLPGALSIAAADPLIAELLALAGLPNVSVKASGLPCYATDPYPFGSVGEVLHRVVDAFGPHRVFWGSDLSRLPCSYAEAVSSAVESLDGLDEGERRLVLGEALLEWLNSPPVE